MIMLSTFFLISAFPIDIENNFTTNTLSASSSQELKKIWENEQTGSGDLVITQGGFVYSLSDEIILKKWNSTTGNLIWTKTLSVTYVKYTYNLVGDGENIYIGGYKTKDWSGNPGRIIKVNATGGVSWIIPLKNFPYIWVKNEIIFTHASSNLSMINITEGSVIESWEMSTGGFLWGDHNNSFYYAEGGQYLTKWKINEGIIWQRKLFKSGNGGLRGCWGSNYSIFTAVEFFNGTIRVSKWNITGNLVWKTDTVGISPSSISGNAKGDLFLVGGTDESTSDFCIDLFDGSGKFIMRKTWRTKSYGDQSLNDVAVSKNFVTTLGDNNDFLLTQWIYDHSPPTIKRPSDISYEQADSLANLTWSASDENPESYTVKRNGSQIDSGGWEGGNITVPVNRSQSLGDYRYTVEIEDIVGHTAQNSCIVTIRDTTAPQILSATYSNATGEISWSAQDRNPASYVIYKNDQEVDSGSWSSGEQLTYTPQSTGDFNLTVMDSSGNRESAIIDVSSIPPQNGGVDQIPGYPLLTFVSLAFITIIACVLYYQKKSNFSISQN